MIKSVDGPVFGPDPKPLNWKDNPKTTLKPQNIMKSIEEPQFGPEMRPKDWPDKTVYNWEIK